MGIKNTAKTAGKGMLELNIDALQNLGQIIQTDSKTGSMTVYDFGEILGRFANKNDIVNFNFSIEDAVLPLEMENGPDVFDADVNGGDSY